MLRGPVADLILDATAAELRLSTGGVRLFLVVRCDASAGGTSEAAIQSALSSQPATASASLLGNENLNFKRVEIFAVYIQSFFSGDWLEPEHRFDQADGDNFALASSGATDTDRISEGGMIEFLVLFQRFCGELERVLLSGG